MFELKKLQEQRAVIENELNTLANIVTTEKRSLNKDELVRWDDHDKQRDEIDGQIETAKRLNKNLKHEDNGDTIVRSQRTDYRPLKVTRWDKENALKFWLLKAGGYAGRIKRNHLEAAEKCQIVRDEENFRIYERDEIVRAQESDVGADGGYLVDQGTFAGLEINLKAFGGLRSKSRVIRTSTDAQLQFPYTDDTGNLAIEQNTSGTLSQNATVANTSQSFTKQVVNAFDLVTGVYPISLQLLEDTEYPILQETSDAVSIRLWRRASQRYAQGTGTNQSTGLCTSASTGLTTAANTGPTLQELVKFKNTIDPDYLIDPSCCWVMHQSSWAYLEGLTDDEGRLALQPYTQSATDGIPMKLLGFPVVLDNSFPAFTSGSAGTFAAFGAMNRFLIRDVRDARIFIQREALLQQLAIGVIGLLRTDCLQLNANAIKLIANHS